MRFVFILLLVSAYSFGHGQTMAAEEKELRQNADFKAFLSAVSENKTTGCLCQPNEYVVFSFSTKNNKTASLCVSKKLTPSSGYLVYRFGTKTKTEFSFPADTTNSLSQFSIAHYHRGGGKQNAAMYINSFRFTNDDYTYLLFDNWNSEDNKYAKGIDVTNNKTGKTVSLNAKGKVIGSLYPFTYANIVTESDEL